MPVFPSQNLYSQKICETYDRLLQIHSGSLVLDGSGSQKQFLDITASYVLNNCCLQTGSTYPITASWSLYSATASYALNIGNTVTQSFSSSSVWTFNHNLGDKYVLIQAFDEGDNQIIPDLINLFDENTAILSFGGEFVSGIAVATIGGFKTIISRIHTGSTYPITSSHSLTASYVAVKNVDFSIKKVTGSYNVTLNDYTILCDATSGSFDVVLPNTNNHTQLFNIKKIDKSGHQIHVYTVGAKYIDYDLTQSISHKGTNMSIQSDRSQYWIL